MIPTMITATTLSDAWFQLVWQLMKGDVPHSVYQIDKGSYVGQKRLEYDYALVTITNPGARPLIPDIPPGLSIPPPVESMEYVEQYFTQYLLNPELEPNETYKYATWLAPGVERVIEQLKGTPGNNQAAVSVGGWAPLPSEKQYVPVHKKDMDWSVVGSIGSVADWPLGCTPKWYCVDTDNFIDPGTGERDPACLRVVDFRLDQKNHLHMVVYFRSWDLWNGLPANLAGLQLLKEYVGQQIGAEDGRIIASSKGLHLYDHVIQVAAERVGMKDVATMDDFLSYAEDMLRKT